ncbi:MAG TPA: M48 family metallopeptidase [Saprospiraceae bacterium]|nr:M48 family metallopeptidase [Saprospiraceae bacterium]
MNKILHILIVTMILPITIYGQGFFPLDTLDHDQVSSLTSFYESRFDKILQEIDMNDKKQKKIIVNFYKEQKEFFLDQIEEKSFIHDKEITEYFHSILKDILVANSINEGEYKILLSAKDEINAYNLGEGSIVVHFGLLDYLSSEDQLASVICHEIGHQILEHVKTGIYQHARLVTSDEVNKEAKKISDSNYNKSKDAMNFIRKLSYNNYRNRRKREIEADSIGFLLYTKTGRKKQEYLSTLKVLDESDLEKDTLTMEIIRNTFNFESAPFKDKWLKTEDNSIFNYDNKNNYNYNLHVDSLKSHPSCLERIKILEEIFKDDFTSIENIDLNNSPSFTKWKENSELQTIYNLYSIEDYGRCLYKSIIYYNKYNNHKNDVKNLIAESLLRLKEAKTEYRINNYIPNIHPTENSASLNLFINFIHNLRTSEMEQLSKNILLN